MAEQGEYEQRKNFSARMGINDLNRANALWRQTGFSVAAMVRWGLKEFLNRYESHPKDIPFETLINPGNKFTGQSKDN